MTAPVVLDRRSVLAGGGALIVSFSLRGAIAQEQKPQGPELPGSLAKSPNLDSWIRIDANGQVTAFTGKAELGQGFRTAFQQIAAEQLDIPFDALKVITADTKLTANEGYTSGSHSMQDSGTAILHAAAQARMLLVAEAAKRFDLAPDVLRTENAAVVAPDGRRLGYGELVAADMLHVQAQPTSSLKDPASFKVMGQPVPARRHSGQGHGRRRLCAGHAASRHGACARAAPAELRCAAGGMRHARNRENARRDSSRVRRQLPGRGGGEGIFSGQGHARAGRRREVAGEREAAEPARSGQRADCAAVEGFRDLPA
ncbi:hypothetical protein ACVL91_005708 [Bradyrhizobium elkanii]